MGLRYLPADMHADLTREMFLAALQASGEMVLPLSGASMGPSWERADGVVVRPVPPDGAGWGDVIVFERHGRRYAHRVILATRASCWTKGDARWAWDRPAVARDAVLGVARGIVRSGQRVDLAPSRCRGAWELLCAAVAWPFVGRVRRVRLQQPRHGSHSV